MNQLYISGRLRVCPKTILHIKRTLPEGKGIITVQLRQEVAPADILGEGQTSTGSYSLNLSQELGVNPAKVPLYLKRQIGQTIFQGELLAQKEGVMQGTKNILAPEDGVLDFYDSETGNLKIKLAVKKNKLISGVYGIIDQINHETGQIFIRTQATAIYGLLGSGKEREGLLSILGSAGALVNDKQISDNLKGKIIIGGGLVLPDTLNLAIKVGAVGFIAGGINVADYKAINGGKLAIVKSAESDIGTTLLITEGFGMAPIGEDIFAILKSHDNRFAVIDGNNKSLILPTNKSDSMIYTRKVKLPAIFCERLSGEILNIELKIGTKVRSLSLSSLGMQGVVESIDQSATKLASGAVTYLVTVAGLKKIRVPYQNLEMI